MNFSARHLRKLRNPELGLGLGCSLSQGGVSVPALDLDFVNQTTLDSRITFTRASAGTRVNSSGLIESITTNNPRFDYDPVTLAAKGLLVEEARTNLILRSAEFDNASWTLDAATVSADATVAPDGTTTAEKLIPSVVSSTGHRIRQAVTLSTVAYSYTVYAKASGYNWLKLRLGTLYANFDLTNGVAGSQSGTSSSIENVGDGWYRCRFTSTWVSNGIAYAYVASSDNAAVDSVAFSGDGTSGIYIWGAQLEAGAFATSYIPTVASTVTRSADVASMTGTAFSNWYNQGGPGALVEEFDSAVVNAASRALAISDGSTNERIEIFSWTSRQAHIVDGGVDQALFDGGEPAVNTTQKVAVAFKANDAALSFNGGAVVSDTVVTLPNVNQMYFGSNQNGGSNYLNGHIKRLRYYRSRLPNTALQSLTA